MIVLSDFFDFLCRKKIRYLLFFLQMVVIFAIIQYTFEIILRYKLFNDKLNDLSIKENAMYFTTQKRGSDKYPECTFAEYESFKNEINKISDNTAFSFGESSAFFADKRIPNALVKFEDEGNKNCEITYISENFLEYYNITVSLGKLFVDTDYKEESKGLIPILLGADYENYFKIGDIFAEKYEVKGILNKNSSYFDTGWESALIYLDNQIIIPMQYQAKKWGGCYVNNLNFSIANKADTAKILQIIENYGFKDYIIKNMAAQLAVLNKKFWTMVSFMTILFITVAMLCIFSTISMLAHLIEEYKTEFGIYMLCGASKWDISLKISMPIFIILLISTIPSMFMCKSIYNYIMQIIMVFAINFAILSFPLMYWLKKPISELKKERT